MFAALGLLPEVHGAAFTGSVSDDVARLRSVRSLPLVRWRATCRTRSDLRVMMEDAIHF
jgi:hypothetical protein